VLLRQGPTDGLCEDGRGLSRSKYVVNFSISWATVNFCS